MKRQSDHEWVIGLHSYRETPPTAAMFADFHAAATRLFARLSVPMTHVAVEGDGYSGNLVKVSSAPAKRLVNTDFENITVLSCVASPEGSDAPGYDWTVSADLSWNLLDELILCVAVDESLAAFLGSEFEASLPEMLEIESWSSGYAFRDARERDPECHVLALDNGKLSEAESGALQRWYSSKSAERIKKPRSIYPVTILNQDQLAFPANGTTVESILEKAPGTTSEKVGPLVVWRIPEDQVQPLRDELGAAGALIA